MIGTFPSHNHPIVYTSCVWCPRLWVTRTYHRRRHHHQHHHTIWPMLLVISHLVTKFNQMFGCVCVVYYPDRNRPLETESMAAYLIINVPRVCPLIANNNRVVR